MKNESRTQLCTIVYSSGVLTLVCVCVCVLRSWVFLMFIHRVIYAMGSTRLANFTLSPFIHAFVNSEYFVWKHSETETSTLRWTMNSNLSTIWCSIHVYTILSHFIIYFSDSRMIFSFFLDFTIIIASIWWHKFVFFPCLHTFTSRQTIEE